MLSQFQTSYMKIIITTLFSICRLLPCYPTTKLSCCPRCRRSIQLLLIPAGVLLQPTKDKRQGKATLICNCSNKASRWFTGDCKQTSAKCSSPNNATWPQPLWNIMQLLPAIISLSLGVRGKRTGRRRYAIQIKWEITVWSELASQSWEKIFYAPPLDFKCCKNASTINTVWHGEFQLHSTASMGHITKNRLW